MIAFCLTRRLKMAGPCEGANHPGDCRKQRGHQVRQEMMAELKVCAGGD